MDASMNRICHSLNSLLFLIVLIASPADAGYPTAAPGPSDLPETLKTPWYYTSSGFGCYESQQSIARSYMDWRTSDNRVCDSRRVANSPDYPADALAGRRVSVPRCRPGDAYNIPKQNGIPHIKQWAKFNFLTQVVDNVNSCPGGTWFSEGWGMDRESYEYCPRGYAIRINNESPGQFFCQLQNPVEDSGELCAGNPISVGTGNKHQVELDFIDTRKGHLRIERHYNNYSWGTPGLFGANWTSSFERRINYHGSNPGLVTVTRENGLNYQYIRQVDGRWQSNTETRETLMETVSGWTYVSTDDETERYDVAGQLQSIEYIDGTIITLNYSSTGLLEEVHSSTGELLTYFEDPDDADDLIDSVTVDAGVGQAARVWKYRRDSNLNLEFVISPDGTPETDSDNPVRQYYYENSVYKYALTGIKDERGIRYATFEYSDAPNAKGNAIRSFHGSSTDPVEAVTVDYHDDSHADDNAAQRTVTNSRGEKTVYQTVQINGKALPVSISGPGCATCSNGGVTTFSYHPGSTNLWQKTENDVTTEYGNYDSNGNQGYIIEAMGTTEERRTDYTYDSRFFGKIQTVTTPSVYVDARKVVTDNYDDFGNRTSRMIAGFTSTGMPVSQTTSWQYDGPLHQLSLVDGPRIDVSDTTLYRYYADDPVEGSNRARLREIENAAGILTRSNIQYTTTGKVVSEVRPNGLQISYQYYPGTDRLETMTRSAATGIQVTRWRYLATGEVESISTADGTPDAVTVTFGYDAARRLVSISDGRGNRIDYQLDSEGNRTGEDIYDGAGVLRKTLARTFDAYNRPDTRRQENERIDSDYAPNGALTRKIDGNGRMTTYRYDALKRLLGSARDPDGVNARTAYSHDVAGQLTAVTDPVGAITRYMYDDLGNLMEMASPDTGVSRYSYDDAGNLITKQDAKGQLFSYTYDSLNRLTMLDAPGTADDITYSYDQCSNGIGKLCTITMGANTVSYAYDAFGNTTAHQTLVYDYSAANRIRSISYPSGSVVSYHYDAAGQVIRVELSGNGVDSVLAEAIRYAPFGDIESLPYGNGTTLDQSMDYAYRLAGQTVTGVLDLVYSQYDGNGNLLTRTDGASGNQDYSYDALDRLTAAAGASGSRDYGYDLNGNRLSLNDGTLTTYGYVPQSNRLATESGWQYTLDANGNTVSRLDADAAGRFYYYSSHNRLLTAVDRSIMSLQDNNNPPQIVDTLLGTYFYNGLGQRVSKNASGTVSQFIYGTDGKLMAELDESGTVTRDYVYLNNQLLAIISYTTTGNGGDEGVMVDKGMGYFQLFANILPWIQLPETRDYDVDVWSVFNWISSNTLLYTMMHDSWPEFVIEDQTTGDGSADTVSTTISYVHNDRLGTPQVMTDESGNEVWRAVYDPFGKATVSTESTRSLNVRFPGQYFDQETNLHQNGFRTYDPATGSYLTADPLGVTSDPTATLSNLNYLYVYARNNPVNAIDPYGLLPGLPWLWPNGGPFGSVCGAGASATFIPDGPFREACEYHDRCYSTCGADKTVCDLVFLLMSGSPVYYGAVSFFGGGAFERAQEEACKYEDCNLR